MLCPFWCLESDVVPILGHQVRRQLEDARETINKLEGLLGVTTPTQWNRSPTQSKQQNAAAPKMIS